MADRDQQTQRTAHERGRLRAWGATIGVGALAVPLPLAGNGISGAEPALAESAIAAGIVHDVPGAQEAYEADVMEIVNRERAAHGCAALTINLAMTSAAYEHSRDMGVTGYFGHNTPAGVTPWTRMEDAGYAQPAAENIAEGYKTPRDVVNSWMNSSGHRENILNCSYKATGVGYYSGATSNNTAANSAGPWWTEDFGYE
jgi:uncharacterized protein YkwD